MKSIRAQENSPKRQPHDGVDESDGGSGASGDCAAATTGAMDATDARDVGIDPKATTTFGDSILLFVFI